MTPPRRLPNIPFHDFPQEVTIELPPALRHGLNAVARQSPPQTQEELLQVVISRGIVEMLGRPESVSAPTAHEKLSVRAIRPFPKPSVLYRERRKKREAVHDSLPKDVGFARIDLEPDPVAHRHVERYVGFAMTEEIRQRLEDYLDANPGLSEEEALAALLEEALDLNLAHCGSASLPSTDAAKKAARMVGIAETLYARAKRRCE